VLNLAIAQRKHCGIAAELLVQVPEAAATTQQKLKQCQCIMRLRRTSSAPQHYSSLMPDVSRNVQGLSRPTSCTRMEQKMPTHSQRSEPDCPVLSRQQGLYFLINRKVKPVLVSRARAVQFTEWVAFSRARHVIAKSDYVARELKNAISSSNPSRNSQHVR